MSEPLPRQHQLLLAGLDAGTVEMISHSLSDLAMQPDPILPEKLAEGVPAEARGLLLDRSGCERALEILKRLRADDATRALPVLVLASGEGPRERLETLEAGANDVLSRPYEPGELLARVRALLLAERQRRNLETSERDRTRLTADLSRQAERMDEVARLTDHYASVLNHDLRSPITNIKGYSDLLAQEALGPLTDEQRQSLEVIQRNTQHLLATLDMLVDLRHIETGRLQLQLGRHEVRDIVTATVDRFARKAGEKGIHLEPPTYDEEMNAFVVCDRHRLAHALGQFLSNAVTYCDRDDRVRVAARHVEGMLELAVTDTGPGIPEAEQDRVFERFARLAPRPTANEKTAGLGLSLARAIIDLHGGTVGFNSRPGGGSRFWLRIPQPHPVR